MDDNDEFADFNDQSNNSEETYNQDEKDSSENNSDV